MGRDIIENQSDKATSGSLNERLTYQTINECLKIGVTEFCICPGGRNSAFIDCLKNEMNIATYFFFDERAAGFFALGRCKVTGRPTAVITTSGTAVGELLPAAMEGYYSGMPLLLITADRPRIFRGSGAPQSAEQNNIFGIYTPFVQDIEEELIQPLELWNQQAPAHLNICLEEKYRHDFDSFPDLPPPSKEHKFHKPSCQSTDPFNTFISSSKFPVAIVGGLKKCDQEDVVNFLLKLKIPVYCEAISGIREDSRLIPYRITATADLNLLSKIGGYPIDGLLRIGTVPTTRFWRDMEKKQGEIAVCSISDLPFSGLSWSTVIHTDISLFLQKVQLSDHPKADYAKLLEADRYYHQKMCRIIEREPKAEVSMIHKISSLVQPGDTLYLGNSLPIREWDLAANYTNTYGGVHANRGLNGIDGQLSTFFGTALDRCTNWAIFGDLTTLYDMTAPWVLKQLSAQRIAIIVINNGGGKIFSRLFENQQIQNEHDYNFESLAAMWRINYERWHEIPNEWNCTTPALIECIPDNQASDRFWKELQRREEG
jgi:2-succinyl-5-enolpyruvyl-6-hydroxy-3-cyclohexene-1-carboxylate synthase